MSAGEVCLPLHTAAVRCLNDRGKPVCKLLHEADDARAVLGSHHL